MDASTTTLTRFEQTKLCDFLFATPVIVLYAFAAASDYRPFAGLLGVVLSGHGDLVAAASLLAHLISFAFAFLVIVLLVLRDPPRAKRKGVLPRLAAVTGTLLGVALLGLPRAALSPEMNIVSTLLIVIGSGFALYAIRFLGKSFSILPEARGLVTKGPYAWIRHPVYFGEAIALFGVMLQFVQPWSFVLFAVQLGWQLARMSYEERVLGDVFQDYAPYRARTARFIPGVY